MILTLKLTSGQIHDLEVDELISVDGKRFTATDSKDLEERMTFVEGQLVSIQTILGQFFGEHANDVHA